MKRFTIAAATAAALTIAAPAAFATTFSFDDVTTMQAANGSEVYTSDGKLFGVLTDVDLDGAEATFIIDTANSSNIDNETVFVVAEEGKVLFSDDRLVLQATEAELDVSLSGTADPNETARILLID
ncbi:hypothetical protein [uncultured Tateyamaria sp.]|uniref:hypothetical protein n=1 Tax=Tateyamaria sp. 1078 TaxID=3417464 RepID=UPI002606486C|nr:hypothetical protein [uncultured Tateyamaria sp.]